VTEAIGYAREHPGEVLELFITEAAAAKHVRLVRAAFAAKVEVTQVTEKAAAALSDAITPQGIVVRCAHPQTTVADVLAGSPKLVVVLVRANDPGNAGTVIRLADAAGADGVILAGDSVDAFNPKAIRASAGSLFHLPVARAADESALLDELSTAGLSVLATTGAAELDLDAAGADGILDLPTAWLFGSEAHGLPDEVVAHADEAVRVPIYGRAESLNLASAAAICLYASASAQRRAATSSAV
jgi:TrmH family RNA methyltransferase